MKKGNSVIYIPEMKGLPKDSVGIVDKINGELYIIIYPQYLPKEGKFTNFVYCHSAKENELKILTK